MNDPVLLIIVGLIGLAVGFALGVAVASLRTPKKARPPSSHPAPRSAPRQAAPVPIPVPPAPPIDQPAPKPPAAMEMPMETPAAGRPAISPVEVFARAFQGDVKTPPPPPRSIAAQIDEILQEMLVDSPLNASAIRLLELPGKGMVVMVGLDQYDGVDAVPNVEIRNLIRKAVAEWERRVSE